MLSWSIGDGRGAARLVDVFDAGHAAQQRLARREGRPRGRRRGAGEAPSRHGAEQLLHPALPQGPPQGPRGLNAPPVLARLTPADVLARLTPADVLARLTRLAGANWAGPSDSAEAAADWNDLAEFGGLQYWDDWAEATAAWNDWADSAD